jgi:hypothetical protein
MLHSSPALQGGMNTKLIYAKTPKGVAEIGNRSGGLSMAVRRVLIMTDGKRSVGELQAMLGATDTGDILAMLAELGHVQVAAGAPAVPAPAPINPGLNGAINTSVNAPMTVPMSPSGADVLDVATQSSRADERLLLPLDEVRRRAVRELTDRLGPLAESLAVRLEQCRTAEELRTRIRDAERLVAGMLGEAAAADYMRALRRR